MWCCVTLIGSVQRWEKVLRCSLYLSPKCLPLSPMYFIVHPGWLQLHLYIALPFWMMLSLAIGATRSSLTVLAPFKWTCTSTLPHMLLKLSLRPLEYGTTKKVLWVLFLVSMGRFMLLCHCFWLNWNSNLDWSLWNILSG